MLNERAGEMVEIDGSPRLKTRPGQGGHAVYGPYAALEPGKHRVEFFIKTLSRPDDERDPLIAIADVTAGLAVTLYYALVFRSHLENDERYVVHFETDRPLSGVEYRLYINGSEPLLIGDASEAVEVGPAETWPQRAEAPALVAELTDRVRSLFFSGAAVVVRGDDLVVTLSGRSVLVKTPQDLAALEKLTSGGPSAGEAPPGEQQTAALVIALGAHAPFGEAGYDLVGHVMNAIYGGHRRAHVTSLAELRAHWSEHRGRAILLTTDCPDTALSYLLTTSNFPIVAFFDDPADVVAYCAAIENQPLPDAIRFCSRSFSCLVGCMGSRQARVFNARQYSWRLGDLIEAIIEALGVAPDAELAARVCAAAGVDAKTSVEEFVRRRAGGETMASLVERRFDPASRALIHAFAANYGRFLTGRENEAIEWPVELFYSGVNGEPGDRFIDLIGGARLIFFGPYLHLPLGNWRALVQFELAGNSSGNEIEADVWAPLAQTAIARCLAILPVQGHFQFALDFVNTDPNAVLEIRVRLVKGAIEGRFGVRRVTLHSVAGFQALPDVATARRLQALQTSLP